MRLFDPVVPESRQHPNFRSTLLQANEFKFKVFNKWAEGFVDRDHKFVEEFQTTFNSGFWELYLYAVLKSYGMKVDFSQNRPDFCVANRNLIIEATIASHPQDGKPEHDWRLANFPNDLNEFNRQAIIRLSNSLVSKHRKYLDSYSSLSHVKGKPFVIAVASFDRPFSFIGCQRAIEAILHDYYVDEETHLKTGGQDRLSGQRLSEVQKDNGSPLPLGMFSTPAYPEISAVIFNGCATMGKVTALSEDPNPNILFEALRSNPAGVDPIKIQCFKPDYKESLLDGLRIYHNPFATNPLDLQVFRDDDVFQSYHSGEDWVYENNDGQLLFRRVEVRVPKKGST
jgi:hypothetical protein